MLISSRAELLYRWTLMNNPKWYKRLRELAWYDKDNELFRKATNYVRANNTEGKVNASEEEIQNAVEEVICYVRLATKIAKEKNIKHD